jgi:hypothetical protein
MVTPSLGRSWIRLLRADVPDRCLGGAAAPRAALAGSGLGADVPAADVDVVGREVGCSVSCIDAGSVARPQCHWVATRPAEDKLD